MTRRYRWGLASCFASCAIACAGAHDPMTPQDHFFVGAEGADAIDCVKTYADAGRAVVDACRARDRADYDRFWSTQFADGGPHD